MVGIGRATGGRAATTNAATGTATPSTNDTAPGAVDDAEDVGRLGESPTDTVEPGRSRARVDLDAADGEVQTTTHVLHGPPPPPRAPRSTFASVKEAEQALRRDFGVDIKTWEWSTEELARIHETFCTLGPVERETLRGLELRRDEGPDRAPRHADGVTGAVFTHGDRVDGDGHRLEGAAITFYDAAFPSTGDSTVDRQATMGVILHEVGHALEGYPNSAALAERRGGAHVAAQVTRFEKAITPDEEALRAKLLALPRDRYTAPLRRAFDEWTHALVTVGDTTRTPEERAAAARIVASAQSRAEAALRALPPRHRARETATALVKIHAAITPLQPRYLDGVTRRDRAEDELAQRGVRLDDPKTPGDETLGALEQAFAELDVKTTPYGATAPVENFAEAYMLYKRDPAALRRGDNGEAAFQFFLTHFPP